MANPGGKMPLDSRGGAAGCTDVKIRELQPVCDNEDDVSVVSDSAPRARSQEWRDSYIKQRSGR